jgi:copper chaperone
MGAFDSPWRKPTVSVSPRTAFIRPYTLEGYKENCSMREITYSVPAMSCSHCEHAVSTELRQVPGVQSVAVDLDTKLIVVRGGGLDDVLLRAAIEEAGYEAVR